MNRITIRQAAAGKSTSRTEGGERGGLEPFSGSVVLMMSSSSGSSVGVDEKRGSSVPGPLLLGGGMGTPGLGWLNSGRGPAGPRPKSASGGCPKLGGESGSLGLRPGPCGNRGPQASRSPCLGHLRWCWCRLERLGICRSSLEPDRRWPWPLWLRLGRSPHPSETRLWQPGPSAGLLAGTLANRHCPSLPLRRCLEWPWQCTHARPLRLWPINLAGLLRWRHLLAPLPSATTSTSSRPIFICSIPPAHRNI